MTEYSLVVIEEEQVALTGSMPGTSPFLPVILTVMGILFLGTLLMIYWSACRKYRIRICQLGGNPALRWNDWNLKKLKETVSEMEWQLTEEK